MEDEVTTEAPGGDLGRTVWRLAGRIREGRDGGLDPGELAQLRRIQRDGNPPPIFWRLLAREVDPEGRLGAPGEQRWAAILAGMAQMAPFHHASRADPGRVMAMSGYPEARFRRLLDAEGEQFLIQVGRVCRFLARKAQAMDWVAFSAFVLATDHERARRARHHLARDYYAALQD